MCLTRVVGWSFQASLTIYQAELQNAGSQSNAGFARFLDKINKHLASGCSFMLNYSCQLK